MYSTLTASLELLFLRFWLRKNLIFLYKTLCSKLLTWSASVACFNNRAIPHFYLQFGCQLRITVLLLVIQLPYHSYQ